MKIILDIDGVILDFVGATLRLLNDSPYSGGRTYTEAMITGFDIANSLALSAHEREWMNVVWGKPGFCKGIQRYPGALSVLNNLRKRGRVVAATAPLLTSKGLAPHWIAERYRALLDLGFDPDDIVFTKDKSLIKGDYLIEDNADNARKWADAHAWNKALLVSRPWNRDAEESRAYRITDTEMAFSWITMDIDEPSNY